MADPSPSDNVEKEDTSAYFILDETGNSTLTPSGVKWVREGPVQSEESGASGEVEESKDDDDFETTGESLQSNTHTDTNTDTEMRSKKLPNRGTPQSARGRRRRLSKRKRQQSLTPVNAKRNKPALGKGQSPAMVTPGNLKKKRRNKKKTKSIIVIGDSDSEHEQVPPLPDISVVEIDDDDSVIVLSDDEVGVCSGSLSTAKKPLKPRNILTTQPPNVQSSLAKPFINSTKSSDAQPQPSQSTTKPVVEDFTGNYIKKTREEPQKDYFELYNPQNEPEKKSGLRPIIIDGSNVAFGHGRDRFSSAGLKICIDYFKKMGHQVTAFVPQFRKTHSATVDPQILDVLEKEGTVSFTPSRRTDGKMIIPYDDRYIVQYADAVGGIIVSRDNYRDLVNENPEYKDTIYKRLLMFTWVGDIIMFPKDPLGRGGPNLQEFLRF